MLPYQDATVENFIRLLPGGTRDILEIGSDIGGEVVCALAERTGARVVGINPSQAFPNHLGALPANARLQRADGRALPFAERSFDAVLSVATMEHVIGLDAFLAEVERVLRPGGVFLTDFSPLWSSALGHHVFAVAGSKEARFWKPGKNPIPNYAHLLWTPDEMREFLRSGPTAEELIEPIVQWVYFEEDINRCHFEEYLEAFESSALCVQSMYFAYDAFDQQAMAQLAAKYGAGRQFTVNGIRAELRKLPEKPLQREAFRGYLALRKRLFPAAAKLLSFTRRAAYALNTIRRGNY